jgi:formate hydrogenlyase subunit 4
MVLDHGGPDLAIVLYGSAVKLFVLAAVALHLVVPVASLPPFAAAGALVAGMAVIAVGIGLLESVMARLRLPRVPQFIIAAGVLAGAGLAILLSSNR